MILNKKTGKKAAGNFRFCRSSFSKCLGLMFRLKPSVLIFEFDKEQKVPLHMLFVFFPIDVIYLDSAKKVVELKENFRPFSFYSPSIKSKYVIELPAGSIKSSGTKKGHTLAF